VDSASNKFSAQLETGAATSTKISHANKQTIKYKPMYSQHDKEAEDKKTVSCDCQERSTWFINFKLLVTACNRH